MSSTTRTEVEAAVKALLVALGVDEASEPFQKTPARVARFWEEFLHYDAGNIDVAFESSVHVDQIVVVRDISFTSMCEHHLLPFTGLAYVGYIPNQNTHCVLGVSKLARIVQLYAHQLQLQERLTDQIAHHVQVAADAFGVAVVLRSQHSCMQMRGIKALNSSMVTSTMLGAFMVNPAAREEFMRLAGL